MRITPCRLRFISTQIPASPRKANERKHCHAHNGSRKLKEVRSRLANPNSLNRRKTITAAKSGANNEASFVKTASVRKIQQEIKASEISASTPHSTSNPDSRSKAKVGSRSEAVSIDGATATQAAVARLSPQPIFTFRSPKNYATPPNRANIT